MGGASFRGASFGQVPLRPTWTLGSYGQVLGGPCALVSARTSCTKTDGAKLRQRHAASGGRGEELARAGAHTALHRTRLLLLAG
jgi:hypothetical protein